MILCNASIPKNTPVRSAGKQTRLAADRPDAHIPGYTRWAASRWEPQSCCLRVTLALYD